MSIHRRIKDFFEPKVVELVGDRLGFNFSPESKDNITMITNYAERTVREFVTGEKEKEYGCTFLITKQFSTDSDDLNLEAMEFADGFSEWVDEQNTNRNYPDLGERKTVQGIEVLQNMPNLSGINAAEGFAVYQIQVRIVYREEID